jgi:hypothetical protein
MFIDWGVYSVPGWAPKKEKGVMYPDWYLRFMNYDKEYRPYHIKIRGENFMPDDFIPLLSAMDSIWILLKI